MKYLSKFKNSLENNLKEVNEQIKINESLKNQLVLMNNTTQSLQRPIITPFQNILEANIVHMDDVDHN